MDAEKFVCKKCSFTTEKLEKLNTHAKKIHVVHNVGKAPDEKPTTTSRSGFHTRETFDENYRRTGDERSACGHSNCNIRHYYETYGDQTKKETDGQTFVRVYDIGCDGSLDN